MGVSNSGGQGSGMGSRKPVGWRIGLFFSTVSSREHRRAEPPEMGIGKSSERGFSGVTMGGGRRVYENACVGTLHNTLKELEDETGITRGPVGRRTEGPVRRGAAIGGGVAQHDRRGGVAGAARGVAGPSAGDGAAGGAAG